MTEIFDVGMYGVQQTFCTVNEKQLQSYSRTTGCLSLLPSSKSHLISKSRYSITLKVQHDWSNIFVPGLQGQNVRTRSGKPVFYVATTLELQMSVFFQNYSYSKTNFGQMLMQIITELQMSAFVLEFLLPQIRLPSPSLPCGQYLQSSDK